MEGRQVEAMQGGGAPGWAGSLMVGLRGCIHRSGQAREEGKPLGNRAAHP